ncbi:hypothetical protein Prum_080040 [Phytohabitans rumicis]|uniref:DinB-like domain-containing protein n=1 Tax=Phytohabitans rumicis TaxID=1076125 RepID=A0A6V8LAX8_9ACTN|nr:hypothetical protein Prum_080040 [Phytohabitans rumicis]
MPYTGDEKLSLHASLNRHREVVLWKVGGLDDERLRQPVTPSGTNLLGLVKHLAANEYAWFCQTFGRETEPSRSTTRTRTRTCAWSRTRAPTTCSRSTPAPGRRPTR